MTNTLNRIVRLNVLVFAALCTQALFAETEPETVFHVARTGSDTNVGDEKTPFVSIQRAQQAVREKIAAGLTSNIRVLIHAGTYALAQPLTFDARDSGTVKFSITYAAVSNEMVVISGGQRITTGWRQEDNGLWSTVIPEVLDGNWYFRNLYVNSRRATRARSPNAKDPALYYTKGFDKKTWAITLGAGQVAAWKNLADVELVVIGPWSIIRKRISYADPATSTIITELPHLGSSGMEEPGIGTACYLENARAFLDQPGEWYLDRSTGVLTYWPGSGEDLTTAEVIAPRLTALLQVRGTARQSVENIHFDGIHFYFADATFPSHGYSGGSQGYYRLDNYNTTKVTVRIDVAVQFEFAKSCTIQNGEIAHVGGNALHLFKGCSQFLIQGNRIYDVGDGGIEIGDRPNPPINPLPSLNVQNHSNAILNNDISDCGTTYHDGVAVLLRPAAQTLVAHNSIHDCTHHGIAIGTSREVLPPGIADGYWIKNNEIKNVCQIMSDSGPIYVWGRQTGNNSIAGNVIHDTRAYGAIYFDDDSSGYRVEGNIVYNIAGRLTQFTGCRPESFTVRNNYWQGTNNFVRGKIGYAISFAPDQFLDLPHQTAMESPQLTVETWVNLYKVPTGPDPTAWVLCVNSNELTGGNYALVVSHNNVGAYLNIGGGRENCYAAWSLTGPLQPGTWHLLALTYDETNLNVYCDGKLAGRTDVRGQRSEDRSQESEATRQTVDRRLQTQDPGLRTQDIRSAASPAPSGVSSLSSNVSSLRSTATGPLRLGKRGDGYNPSFPGLINEVNIYNRALSADEIAAHYAQPTSVASSALSPQSSVSSLKSKVSGLPDAPAFHWNANDTYSALEQIMSHAGPEEPYRNRFAASREPRVESLVPAKIREMTSPSDSEPSASER